MRTKTLIGALVIALCAVAAIQTSEGRQRGHSFAALVQSYYDAEFRAHPIMAGQAAALDDKAIEDLAAYFSRQTGVVKK